MKMIGMFTVQYRDCTHHGESKMEDVIIFIFVGDCRSDQDMPLSRRTPFSRIF